MMPDYQFCTLLIYKSLYKLRRWPSWIWVYLLHLIYSCKCHTEILNIRGSWTLGSMFSHGFQVVQILLFIHNIVYVCQACPSTGCWCRPSMFPWGELIRVYWLWWLKTLATQHSFNRHQQGCLLSCLYLLMFDDRFLLELLKLNQSVKAWWGFSVKTTSNSNSSPFFSCNPQWE